MNDKSIDLHIPNADDRLTVGTILLKHGYTVEQVKLQREGRKVCEIILRAIRNNGGDAK